MVRAGGPSRLPPCSTRNVPPWVVMSKRPSGVKASAVGPPTLATRVSAKSAGRFWADTAEDREAAATRIVHIVSNRGHNLIETSGTRPW